MGVCYRRLCRVNLIGDLNGVEWCGWSPGSLGRVRQSGLCQEL